MRVTVSVCGKFHAFDLAGRLQDQGYLERLITSYPKFAARPYGIPPGRVSSLVSSELGSRAMDRLTGLLRGRILSEYALHEIFDLRASRRIPTGTDVYVGWSACSERGLLRAHQLGAIAIVERGSSHIAHQRDLLLEEARLHGARIGYPAPPVVAKEAREYSMADYISVPSRFAERSFLERGFPPEKLIRVPYGVNLDSFSPQPPSEDGIFRVVSTGTLCLRKGTHYLLRAFA